MTDTINLSRLADFFEPEDIEWKPITFTKDRKKGLAAAYVTNRAVMDRLDEVAGPGNWKNEFQTGPDGGVLCGISVRVGDGWVTKWDGAENSDIEPVKGGLSNAMRRAAVQWGIGRYLYKLPAQWVSVDERGRFSQEPAIPPAFLPVRPVASPETQRSEPVETTPAARPASAQPTPSTRRPAARNEASSDARRAGGDAEEYFMPKNLPF